MFKSGANASALVPVKAVVLAVAAPSAGPGTGTGTLPVRAANKGGGAASGAVVGRIGTEALLAMLALVSLFSSKERRLVSAASFLDFGFPLPSPVEAAAGALPAGAGALLASFLAVFAAAAAAGVFTVAGVGAGMAAEVAAFTVAGGAAAAAAAAAEASGGTYAKGKERKYY